MYFTDAYLKYRVVMYVIRLTVVHVACFVNVQNFVQPSFVDVFVICIDHVLCDYVFESTLHVSQSGVCHFSGVFTLGVYVM